MDIKTDTNTTRPVRPRRLPTVMMGVRKLHLYGGVLLAPAILFFAVTGILQVYGQHEPNQATGAPPFALIARLGNLHKTQSFALPAKDRPKTKDRPKAKDASIGMASGAAPHARAAPKSLPRARILLKAFVTAAAIGLALTTLLGLYMAYAPNRSPWLVGGLLAAGVLVPLILVIGAGT